MNHSIYTADKATHLKVVVAALLAGIAIVATTLGTRLARAEMNAQVMATQTIYKPRPSHPLAEMALRGIRSNLIDGGRGHDERTHQDLNLIFSLRGT